MDLNSFMQAISTVGFPIACCIYLIYSNNKNNEFFKQEIEKLRETVENYTIVMTKICSKIGVDNSKGN